MRTAVAFIAAILVPVAALVAWFLYGQFSMFDSNDPYIWVRTRGFFFICLTVSAAHVIALGIPAYLLLRWRGLLRWWSVLLVGFTLGSIPAGVFSWPLRYAGSRSSASVNGVDTMIDGVPTMAGWLHYVGGASFFGACGLVAAAAFCAVRGMRPEGTSGQSPPRRTT